LASDSESLPESAIVPVGYQGSPVGLTTVHSMLNRITKFVIDGVIQNRIGAPSDTALIDGNTLWSQLNWVLNWVQDPERAAERESFKKILGFHGDNFSTESYTVSSLWRLIQRCLDGTLYLMNQELITSLINYVGPSSGLGAAMTSLCNSITEENANALLTKSQSLYNLLAECIRTTVTVALPEGPDSDPVPASITLLEGLLTKANEAIAAVCASPVELAEIVRQAMYEWLRLLDRANTDNARIRANYVGLEVRSGATLINTLYNICRVVHVDPILKKLGRNLDAPATTILGKVSEIGAESTTSTANYKVNTLTLLYYLLDAYPVIGELNTTGGSPFFSYLNGVVGTISDTDDAETLFGQISNYTAFGNIVTGIKTTLDGMVAKLYASSDTEKEIATNTLLGTFEWVNYHHLFAALINNATVDQKSFRQEFYSTPLIFMMSGIPYLASVKSLKDSMTGVANLGVASNTWMALKDQTLYSSFNFMQKVITDSYDLFAEKSGLVTAIATAIKGLSSPSSLYSTLTAPLYDIIEEFAQYTAPSTYAGSLVTKFAGHQDLGLVQGIAKLILLSKENHYPINFRRIYSLLKQVDDVANAGVPAFLGYSTNDHPLDTTIYGKLNGVLFEVGAQLLLNFIGGQDDPLNAPYETYYSKLCAAERAATILAVDAPDKQALIKANADFIRRNLLSTLVGAISFYYKQCLPEATGSKFATLATELVKEYEAGSLIIDRLDRSNGTLVPHVVSMIKLLTGSEPQLPEVPQQDPETDGGS
jgi:hypothetical protein